MFADAIALAFWAWAAAALLALLPRTREPVRWLLAAGCAAGVVGALQALPGGSAALAVPWRVAGIAVRLEMAPGALWLLGFGLVSAFFACLLGTPVRGRHRAWQFGAALSLIGALGVFGLRDGASFLIAWELMSLGGAAMILGEGLGAAGRPVLFMLALLEFGAVALLAALLWLGATSGDLDFGSFAGATAALAPGAALAIGLLLLVGFGAKLGLLPFYEWFPRAYGSASGATGTLLSGVVLNAAFYALSQSLFEWLAPLQGNAAFALGAIVVAAGVLSSILAMLYAFQQEDWRCLLAFSSAENASIAVAMLGACLLFRNAGLAGLAGLAWTVALLHLAGHALAKGALFLAADGVYRGCGDYRLAQRGWLRSSGPALGVGALFAAMSLAAIPPQAGFVSEWYVFQTVFQGFHLASFGGRLTLALAGAGLALTAALAIATFVKAFGVGMLGAAPQHAAHVPRTVSAAVGVLGLGVLALAVGMPVWLGALEGAVHTLFAADSARRMVDGWLLVPLTAKFAFISPSLLVIVMPLLALLPLLLLFAWRHGGVRRAPVWYGGMREDPAQAATTALSFSNAMRTFYSFVYRPVTRISSEHAGREYFVTRLVFDYDVAPVFGPWLFAPATRLVRGLADRLRLLQSGNLNFYLAIIGALLVVILGLTLW